MKTIIFIALNKSGSSREAVKAAEQLGYYTVVFTDREKQIQDRKEYPDVHQLILSNLSDLEMLRTQIESLKLRGNEIAAITSFVDQHVYTASLLADEFCHNYLSSDAIFVMENKEETRKHFSKEAYTPAFLLIEEDTQPDIETSIEKVNYPAMVKCSKSTGSKDVFFCASRKELLKHVTRLREKDPGETLIIEEYIDGEQYLVEVLVYKGQIRTAAIVKQEITRGKRFIITGYGVLAEVQPGLEEGITKIIQSIVSSLKINNGAFHLELRLTDRGWKLIEINPRISGGAMNKMIQAAFGYNLVKETLKMLLGDSPSLKRQTNQFVFTQHVIIKNKGVLEKVTGKGRAIKTPGVVEVYIKPKKGTFITPPLSMGHRYAYVIAAGDSMEKAERSAKKAANEIVFHIREEGQKNTRIE